jgi:hypothetical protein
MRIDFICLALLLTGCSGAAAPSTPAAEEGTTLQAWSTVGWGSPAPPFRRHACGGVEETPGEDPAKCYFFTRTKGEGEPWNVGRVNGSYLLIGSWTGTSLTHAEWLAQQNKPAYEGVDATAKFPLFEVERYCIQAADVERHSRLLAEMRDDAPSDAESTRRWLRDHQCR